VAGVRLLASVLFTTIVLASVAPTAIDHTGVRAGRGATIVRRTAARGSGHESENETKGEEQDAGRLHARDASPTFRMLSNQ
jgi:hypothetical protein